MSLENEDKVASLMNQFFRDMDDFCARQKDSTTKEAEQFQKVAAAKKSQEQKEERSSKKPKKAYEISTPSNMEINPQQKPGQLVEQIRNTYDAIKKEEEEMRKLSKTMDRKQQRYMKREMEYRTTIEELQRELRVRSGLEKDALPRNREIIDSLHNKIMNDIDGIPLKTVKIIDEQQKDIARVFNSKLSEIKNEIDNEAKKGIESENMKEREDELNHHLELMTKAAQKIGNENQNLKEKNKKLRLKFQAQENDRVFLLRDLVQQKKENAIISEQLDYLKHTVTEVKSDIDDEESQAGNSRGGSRGASRKSLSAVGISHQKNASGEFNRNAPMPGAPSSQLFKSYPHLFKNIETREQKVQKFERIIGRVKHMLEIERKNLKKGRTQYAREIQNRTELEELLRKCVDQVKEEIHEIRPENMKGGSKRRSIGLGGGGAVDGLGFTQEDREKIIEILLSQERVLALLYDKTFLPRDNVENNLQNEFNDDLFDEDKVDIPLQMATAGLAPHDMGDLLADDDDEADEVDGIHFSASPDVHV